MPSFFRHQINDHQAAREQGRSTGKSGKYAQDSLILHFYQCLTKFFRMPLNQRREAWHPIRRDRAKNNRGAHEGKSRTTGLFSSRPKITSRRAGAGTQGEVDVRHGLGHKRGQQEVPGRRLNPSRHVYHYLSNFSLQLIRRREAAAQYQDAASRCCASWPGS
jgi:hypothetical protein